MTSVFEGWVLVQTNFVIHKQHSIEKRYSQICHPDRSVA
jgi:hypothetical protein